MKKSVRKLTEEAKQEKHPYVKIIVDFLVDHINNNPDFGKYILRQDRTVVGSLEYVKGFAKEQQLNGVAVMADDVVFAHVLKYFKLKELPKPKVAPRPASTPPKRGAKAKEEQKFEPAYVIE